MNAAYRPMLATLVNEPFDDKVGLRDQVDGFRLITEKRGDTVRVWSRNGLDVTKRYQVLLPPHQKIGEFLRFDAPTQRGIRTARQDFRIGGKEIRKGQILHIMIGAANRDPEQFENPDRLDIARSPNRHVSLGHGVHYCLGAALARLELSIALTSFLARYPDYRLASDNIVFIDRTASRRPTNVPVLSR
jgi:cytochrome P450